MWLPFEEDSGWTDMMPTQLCESDRASHQFMLRVDLPCTHVCALSPSGNKAAWVGKCLENSQNLSPHSCFWALLLLIFLLLADRWIKPSTVEVIGEIQSSLTLLKSASWSDYREGKPTHSLNECHKPYLITASRCTYILTNTRTLTHPP